jgi:hypothetical protein
MREEEKKINASAVRDSIVDLYRRGYGQKFYASQRAVSALNDGSTAIMTSIIWDTPSRPDLSQSVKIRFEVHADKGLTGEQVAV